MAGYLYPQILNVKEKLISVIVTLKTPFAFIQQWVHQGIGNYEDFGVNGGRVKIDNEEIKKLDIEEC